jgi:hypothetical protein
MPPLPATPSRHEPIAPLLVLGIVLLLAGQAAAEEIRPRVLISAPPPIAKDLASLIQGELEALDLEVIVEHPGDPAHEGAVDAVLGIAAEPRSVTIWLASEMRVSTYAADPRALPGRDESLARQVAEVLRAELLISPQRRKRPSAPPIEPEAPLASSAPAPPPRLTAPDLPWPAHRAEAAPEEPLGTIAVAPTLTLSPGPIDILPHLAIDLRLTLWQGLRLQALGLLPLGDVTIAHPRGAIFATTTLVGVGLGYDTGAASFRFTPSIGVGWQWIRMIGHAPPPLVGSSASAHLAQFFAGVDAAHALASWLWLVGGARVGVVVPEARIVVAGEALGSVGRPAVQLFSGLAMPFGAQW